MKNIKLCLIVVNITPCFRVVHARQLEWKPGHAKWTGDGGYECSWKQRGQVNEAKVKSAQEHGLSDQGPTTYSKFYDELQRRRDDFARRIFGVLVDG